MKKLGFSSWLLVLLILCSLQLVNVVAAEATTNNKNGVHGGDNKISNRDYLYLSIDPPEAAYPIKEHYHPNPREDPDVAFRPEFIYNDQTQHHRIVVFYSPLW
jgi:hypothetical protein